MIKKCGRTIPSKIISSGNRLTVRFHSNSSVTSKGFRATWNEMRPPQMIIDYGRREVKSPNYPSNYPHNSHTSKTIQVSAGAKIELTFLYFSLEASSSCRYDYVQGIKGSQRKNFFTLFISVGHFWSPVDQEMWQHRPIRNHEQWQQADREVPQRLQRHKERVQSHMDGSGRKWRMEEEKRS